MGNKDGGLNRIAAALVAAAIVMMVAGCSATTAGGSGGPATGSSSLQPSGTPAGSGSAASESVTASSADASGVPAGPATGQVSSAAAASSVATTTVVVTSPGIGSTGTTAGSAGASLPVNAATISRFVGVGGMSDQGRTIITQLGVVFINTPAGVTVLQAKSIAGDTISAKVTYTGGAYSMGSYVGIVQTGTSLKVIGPPPLDEVFTPYSFSAGAIASYLGSWTGHSRQAVVTSDGRVQFTMRDYSKPSDAPSMTADGVLVPFGGGWQLRIYLSTIPEMAVGSPQTIALDGGVLTIGAVTYCGATAPVGACGA